MRKISVILSIFVFAFAAFQTAFAQTKIAPLNIKQRTLKNGLKVVSLQDNSSPTVTVQVWFDVGSKNDPNGRNGFAHLFEHLMFKSTKNLKSEQFDRLTEDVGGNNNAFTSDDVTAYHEVVPSNYLETLLWAEAERLSNLNVDEPNFLSERKVVQEEFRQGVLAQPYGRFYEAIQTLSYTTHPYKRTTIGTIEDLDAATVEDAQNFHKTFYRPDNATLIVVGDFEQKQFDAWVDKYFNRIEKPTNAIPRVTEVEPARTAEKRQTVKAPNVPLPAVAITYLAPDSKSKDIAALKIAQAILSGGESSRLYQELVYKQQIAQEASFGVDERVDKGLLNFTAVMASGKTPEMGEKSLLAELKNIQNAPVSAKELEKAKNGIVANALRELQTNRGKAFAIGNGVIYHNNPDFVNLELKELQAVTIADVQRVMKQYFTDNNRVVIYYVNEENSK
ncbi:MAG: insulinase family protein [Acidobacteria bacterium]|jgi:zinc protease|nr:insulinase family protein [Acidobacteriota bacterium]